MPHPRDKRERILIRKKKYKKRLKNLGIDDGKFYVCYVHQGKPCSCYMCSGEKYYRPVDGKYDDQA